MPRQPGSTVDEPADPPHPGPAEKALADVRAWVADEVAQVEREAAEIDMLVTQTRTEAERHEARRLKVQEQVKDLERAARPDEAEILKAREQLVGTIQRASLMDAQKQILEGKQRTLQRYRERIDTLGAELQRAVEGGAGDASAVGSGRQGASRGPTGTGSAAGYAAGWPGSQAPGAETPRGVLRAQEDLRRDIARQMHDGPAQSLANIALQAEIVQRSIAQDPRRAAVEVDQLRATVQHALDATKTFIFDVRPMVLDDLGLVPTLRRAAADRGRRAGIPVGFESVGADQRLGPDVESNFFRILDDALAGYLGLRPSAVHIRLDWSPQELRATVSSGRPEERAASARAAADARRSDPTDLPPALAQMIEAQRAGEREAWTHARALPAERWRDIQTRAEAVGVSVALLEDDQTLEAIVRVAE